MSERMEGKRNVGFTIIELLIVIVIIAILAAISLVAYGSIQDRTENTKTTQAISQYVKIFKMYASTNSIYPTNVAPPTAPPSSFWTCLPYDVNSCGSPSGASPVCFGLSYTLQNAAFKTELQTIATTLPSVSNRALDCSSSYTIQGALAHVFNTGVSAQIDFLQVGDVDCPLIGGTRFVNRAFAVNATRCVVALPDLS